jgi:hypothetical protein
MRHLLGPLLILCVVALAVTTLASALAWWLEPERRTARTLARLLGAPPEALVLAAPRSQGAGLRLDEGRIAVVRGVGDPGLVYDLSELIGVELIFDGQVSARMFRGEARRPLDQIAPDARRVMLRMVFDDVRDPEFELELLSPTDLDARDPPHPQGAVQEARRWYSRLEAVLRRAGGSDGLQGR